jgi:hypothetical protein
MQRCEKARRGRRGRRTASQELPPKRTPRFAGAEIDVRAGVEQLIAGDSEWRIQALSRRGDSELEADKLTTAGDPLFIGGSRWIRLLHETLEQIHRKNRRKKAGRNDAARLGRIGWRFAGTGRAVGKRDYSSKTEEVPVSFGHGDEGNGGRMLARWRKDDPARATGGVERFDSRGAPAEEELPENDPGEAPGRKPERPV